MIHTANFYVTLSQEEIYELERKFNTTINLLLNSAEQLFNGVTIFSKKKKETNMFFIYAIIDFIKFLNKEDGVIIEDDYEETNKKITHLEKVLFNSSKKFILLRIDYRFDAVIKNREHREFLLSLYEKLSEKHKFQKKCNIDTNTNIKYKTSMYFNSKSINVIVYDKERQKQDKHEKIEKYEYNVLRFEVRLQNKHLLNMKSKKNRPKTLKTYFKYNLFKEYMLKYVAEIFFTADYHNPYYAQKIINQSNLKDKEKLRSIQFLNDISRNGIENIKKWTDKNKSKKRKSLYSRPTFNKYISILNKLNINPILIPKNRVNSPKLLKNPLHSLKYL
ncbi:hypothetical protein COK10_19875 [Bacillus anthracis]|nr:hypothetical protein COK10_19875 [Bacillus anthracis]